MQKWHVLQTKPLKENDVCLLLKQGGFETFCPKILDYRYRNRLRRSALSYFQTTPLFPSYIFAFVDFEKNNNFHLLKYTRGVNKILCADGKPIPLSSEIINLIKQRTNAQGIIERTNSLKIGDTIRVKKGILKDLMGILEKPMPRDGRVQVLLKLVNYEMRARLHFSEVEKVDKGDKIKTDRAA